jgi:acetyl esterase/lipase
MLQIKTYDIEHAEYQKKVTVYQEDSLELKAAILYFHGGGLLYGTREDLPELHIETITKAGYAILSYDYPLAPIANLELIHKDVCDSVHNYLSTASLYVGSQLPYFLWGRSAGAYLCLLAAAKGDFFVNPHGIISYYGYGFLCDNWFKTPSAHYKTFPAVPSSCVREIKNEIETNGPMDTHFMRYVYARQTGNWKELIFTDREIFLYLNYSLRLCDHLPCPLFCAHSTRDTDVPYEEFLELQKKYRPEIFVASTDIHDFDRLTDTVAAKDLLEKTIQFLNRNS